MASLDLFRTVHAMSETTALPAVDFRIPEQDAAWRLSVRTAHQLLRRAGAGHGSGLTLVSLALATAALVGPRWLFLPAAVTAAAGMYLLRAKLWGAAKLYPQTVALVQAVGLVRARAVCERFVADPAPRDVLTLEDGFALSVRQQIARDRAKPCSAGHHPLCAHRPPDPVADCPPLLALALYGTKPASLTPG